MSVGIPLLTVALGSYGISQGDIVNAKVHLGGTKEVSSWELKLQNWGAKYSPSGTYPLSVGLDGSISIGRGSNVPLIITTRTEEIKYESNPLESYVTVSGRCWGEKLFRQVVTKTYASQKGEAIVKDLLDYYSGLSHNRTGTELVEDTDTTFTLLEYSNTPVWDILRSIAESSDKTGVIGYDFRVAPDGKFEFFPRGSKTSSVSLSEKIEESLYSKNIFGVRNRVWIYGAADKSVPLDKDVWTESLTPSDGAWSVGAGTDVVLDTSNKMLGSASIKLEAPGSNYYACAILTLNSGKEVDANLYPVFNVFLALDSAFDGNIYINLVDTSFVIAQYAGSVSANNKWCQVQVKCGSANAGNWNVSSGFDWSHIKKVAIYCNFPGTGGGNFWVDSMFFGGRRYSDMQEDPTFVEGFETLGDWTVGGTGATQEADTTYFKEGVQSLKVNAIGGNAAYSTKTISGLFLSENGFGIWAYVHDLANLNNIAIYISSSSNFNRYFLATIVASGLNAGWNHILLTKDDFTNIDGDNWNTTMVRLRVRVNPKVSVNASVGFDYLNSSDSEEESSQSAYDLRMYVDTDEELYSDNECVLRAKAVLANKKDPAEYLTVKSTVIDYGLTPLLPEDMITVVLPNENINASFRIISVEYEVDGKTQTLTISLELGRETPLLADYMYRLSSKMDHLSRHKIAR